MKKKSLRTLVITILLFLLVMPGVSQESRVKIYSANSDTTACGPMVSAYRDFFRIKLYNDALVNWRPVFRDCPSFSEMIYVDGVTMYRSFIELAPEGPVREGLIDTLMLIYDRRMENFLGEGNVLGRKGRDLLNYRGSDIEQVQKAHTMLRRSIELQGVKSLETTMVLCMSSGIALKKEGVIDEKQVLEDYLMVLSNLIRLQKESSRWDRARTAIDEMIFREDIVSCKALDRYYEAIFEENQDDLAFLETVISSYHNAGCDRSEFFAVASENLYRLEPGPESAHNVAIRFISVNDLEKAAKYLKEAVQAETIDPETKAQWYYELSVVSMALQDNCQAIVYAREAIKLKSDFGQAYILLGDAFIASRNGLGDEFQQRTAYWAAADKYASAASMEPSLAEEINIKLKESASQYPGNEDIFFHDIKEGEQFIVGGCINEKTTVRARKEL
ncbi:MAG: hypothetical protein P1P86_14785 [Bacteroidales bacterium]|nr:hypothetical protein [Bacteroidales bacterium]